MFRTVSLSIIRSFGLHTQQWYMSYKSANTLWAGSFSQAVSKSVLHTPLLCVQWKSPDDWQRNCPKHVEFHSKNKFEKLVHLFGFIIRNLTRRTVTWRSNDTQLFFAPHQQQTGTLLQHKQTFNCDLSLLSFSVHFVVSRTFITLPKACYLNLH